MQALVLFGGMLSVLGSNSTRSAWIEQQSVPHDTCRMGTMHIDYERSGGFAGLQVSIAIDTDSLPPGEAQELCNLVEDAGFFDLSSALGDSTAVPDQFVYKVTVEAAGRRRHTIEVTESAVPPDLRPLLERLHRAARRARRSGGS